MNIYCKKKNFDDGTIIYEKDNIITDDYEITEEENLVKFKPKKNIMIINSIDELKKINFTDSKINKCLINCEKSHKNKYTSIVLEIYKLIGNGTAIIKNSILNIKTKNITNKGFTYHDDLGISIQSADSNKTFCEIVNQCLKNKITFEIEIELSDKKITIIKTDFEKNNSNDINKSIKYEPESVSKSKAEPTKSKEKKDDGILYSINIEPIGKNRYEYDVVYDEILKFVSISKPYKVCNEMRKIFENEIEQIKKLAKTNEPDKLKLKTNESNTISLYYHYFTKKIYSYTKGKWNKIPDDSIEYEIFSDIICQYEKKIDKLSKRKNNIKTESESESESEPDIQLEKLGISKTDLIQFTKLSKDGCTHWFNYIDNKIYTLDRKQKWIKGDKSLYSSYSDEIEQIKKKISDSTQNKSTKLNVLVKNVNTDSDEKDIEKSTKTLGQNTSKYKSKAKINSKYISEDSDDSNDLSIKLSKKK